MCPLLFCLWRRSHLCTYTLSFILKVWFSWAFFVCLILFSFPSNEEKYTGDRRANSWVCISEGLKAYVWTGLPGVPRHNLCRKRLCHTKHEGENQPSTADEDRHSILFFSSIMEGDIVILSFSFDKNVYIIFFGTFLNRTNTFCAHVSASLFCQLLKMVSKLTDTF